MISKGLGDNAAVVVDPNLRVLLLLCRGCSRWRRNSAVVSRSVAGLLHLTAPRVGEKPLAGYVSASWSSMVVVTVLVDLIKDLGETLLGLLPCLLDSTDPVLCCCKLGSGVIQLKP